MLKSPETVAGNGRCMTKVKVMQMSASTQVLRANDNLISKINSLT